MIEPGLADYKASTLLAVLSVASTTSFLEGSVIQDILVCHSNNSIKGLLYWEGEERQKPHVAMRGQIVTQDTFMFHRCLITVDKSD